MRGGGEVAGSTSLQRQRASTQCPAPFTTPITPRTTPNPCFAQQSTTCVACLSLNLWVSSPQQPSPLTCVSARVKFRTMAAQRVSSVPAAPTGVSTDASGSMKAFKVLKVLGKGSYGTVMQCKRKSDGET